MTNWIISVVAHGLSVLVIDPCTQLTEKHLIANMYPILLLSIIAHLDDWVDDDDIEQLNDEASCDSLGQLLRGFRQSCL